MKQMVDVFKLYDFKSVLEAESQLMYLNDKPGERSFFEDLPVFPEMMSHITDMVYYLIKHNPEATKEDFHKEGRFFPSISAAVEDANKNSYAIVNETNPKFHLTQGFVQLKLFRGFQKPKHEIDAFFNEQKQNAKLVADAAARSSKASEDEPEFRAPKVIPANNRVLPVYNPPGMKRTPTFSSKALPPPKYVVKKAAPPKKRSLSGGDTESTLSLGQESSLTRLLESVGSFDNQSQIWTLETSELSKLFPKRLPDRESTVLVAEFCMDDPTLLVAGHESREPEVVIEA